jgi:predicted metal-dependent enzyme (double-stranded beta helix superfamily)
MFDKDNFVEDCIQAIPEGQAAMRELLNEATSDCRALVKGLGEPEHAGIVPLYRSPQLTIINFAWAPYMSLMPHNHHMYSVIGIYSGREDNVFWRRTDSSIEAAGADSLGAGDVATLGTNIIHSVTNPIGKMTSAIHIYGGDFFEPEEPRSEWDHETLVERPWDVENARKQFAQAEARFNAINNTDQD